ncbi:glycyl-radical enzyme activating protein [Mycobacterium sp. CVI_P3]|uniref:Glycyl-radical enzyme activating protein n=1 Tax=Mycobacterium pinniadriaticum TaxID=2994102 RepID=A0ABT3SPH0_9MYCO|nr:glycyl-radical enzyme activating protein [Mycobacterium pinniadriaticum]MCX2935013.1 glycyl-radical enzyme activating protein [Mycobacterium pinniadriaticum]MCX2941434.1 glycyl-radical enzyme activating protein [Mycobacterium pinniadriaticum]
MKHNSLEDGPGIRSVVFLKGCNLNCSWCHNPESKHRTNELYYDRGSCISCRECVAVCPQGALRIGDPSIGEPPVVVDRQSCTTCFECVDSCPSRALSAVGRTMSVDDVVRDVVQYTSYFQASGGGVTVSGGEPTLFMDFLSALLQRFKAEGLHTLVETNGRFCFDDFEGAILPHTDVIYLDMKILDRHDHRRFCGTYNDVIKDNFLRLHRMSQTSQFCVIPRTPLIPDITDTEKNIRELAQFYEANGVTRTIVLKSNPLWADKGPCPGVVDTGFVVTPLVAA